VILFSTDVGIFTLFIEERGVDEDYSHFFAFIGANASMARRMRAGFKATDRVNN